MPILQLSASFGPLNTGQAANVRYRLGPGAWQVNPGAGIVEDPNIAGDYFALINIPDGFQGRLDWNITGTGFFFGLDINPAPAVTVAAAAAPSFGGALASGPAYSPFCTDEDIAVRWGGDYFTLCPQDQTRAYGTDGAIVGGSWQLSSVSNNFQTQGVGLHSVVAIKGAPFVGTGSLFAVDSASGGMVTLRRKGESTSVGLPPTNADATGLTFDVRTYASQIEDATYGLCKRFGIDPNKPLVSQQYLEDPRVFRQATVLTVIYRMLSTNVRTDQGDWKLKRDAIRDELSETTDRINVRWGPGGTGWNQSQPSTTVFGMRLGR